MENIRTVVPQRDCVPDWNALRASEHIESVIASTSMLIGGNVMSMWHPVQAIRTTAILVNLEELRREIIRLEARQLTISEN